MAGALDQALGDRTGVRRYGDARAPLDEALCHATVDLSGRGMATVDLRLIGPSIGELPTSLVPHFFDTLPRQSRIGIHLSGAGRTTTTWWRRPSSRSRWRFAPPATVDARGPKSVPSTKGAL